MNIPMECCPFNCFLFLKGLREFLRCMSVYSRNTHERDLDQKMQQLGGASAKYEIMEKKSNIREDVLKQLNTIKMFSTLEKSIIVKEFLRLPESVKQECFARQEDLGQEFDRLLSFTQHLVRNDELRDFKKLYYSFMMARFDKSKLDIRRENTITTLAFSKRCGQFYGAPQASKLDDLKYKCMMTGVTLSKSQVSFAQIYQSKWPSNTLSRLGVLDNLDPRNFIVICKELADDAFERQRIVVDVTGGNFITKVLDPLLMQRTISHATGKLTYADIHNRPLTFLTKNRPYKRCLAYHGVRGIGKQQALNYNCSNQSILSGENFAGSVQS